MQKKSITKQDAKMMNDTFEITKTSVDRPSLKYRPFQLASTHLNGF